MSLAAWASRVSSARFPRVSGDEPMYQNDARISPEFSPRERG